MITSNKYIFAVVDADDANKVIEYQITAADALASARWYRLRSKVYKHLAIYKTPLTQTAFSDDYKFISLDTDIDGYVAKNVAGDPHSKLLPSELYCVHWCWQECYRSQYYTDIMKARQEHGALYLASHTDARLCDVEYGSVTVLDVDPDENDVDSRYEEVVHVGDHNYKIISNQINICF